MGLGGLTAVVSGGASGISAAISLKLKTMGAQVAVLDLTPENIPAGQLGIQCDVTDDVSVRKAIAKVAQEFGGLDIGSAEGLVDTLPVRM